MILYYMKWTGRDVEEGLAPIRVLLTEVNDEGRVLREIGLDANNRVIHKAPTKKDNYGIFDLQRIDKSSLKSDIDAQTFEQLWKDTR